MRSRYAEWAGTALPKIIGKWRYEIGPVLSSRAKFSPTFRTSSQKRPLASGGRSSLTAVSARRPCA
jgi:hypothetical protein